MSPWSYLTGRRVRGAVVSAVLALLVCTGCGSQPPSEGDRSETHGDKGAGSAAIHARYVETLPGEEDWRAIIDVVTDGDRRVRLSYTVPGDDPVTIYSWVWDGHRVLEFGDDAKTTYSVLEATDVEQGLQSFLRSWIVKPGSDEFTKACRDAHQLQESRTIAGREAVGFNCGAGRWQATLWLDKETHLRLSETVATEESSEDVLLMAEEVTLDPPIDDSTFSTDLPPDRDEGGLVPSGSANEIRRADARRDVVATQDGGNPLVRPGQRDPDVVRTLVAHREHALVIRLHFRDLVPDRRRSQWIMVRVPGNDSYSVTVRWRRDGSTLLTIEHSPDEVACAGFAARMDDERDYMRIEIPRGCLGSPRWVRAGVLLERVEPETFRMLADDPLSDDPHPYPVMSERLYRA